MSMETLDAELLLCENRIRTACITNASIKVLLDLQSQRIAILKMMLDLFKKQKAS